MHKNQKTFIILCLIPASLLYLVFFIYPSLKAFYVSLFSWYGFSAEMTFVGLGNFVELFHSSEYWRVLLNTLGYLFIGGFFVFSIAFLFTYLLNRLNVRARSVIQVIIFFPMTVAPIAVGITWGFIYNRRWGLLNEVLRVVKLGFLCQTWMNPELIFWSVLVVIIWIHVGFFVTIFVAAVSKVPTSFYDAAKIEGATDFQIFTRITFPLIRDAIRVSMILWIIMILKIFDVIYVFTGGGVTTPPIGHRSLAAQMYLLSFGERAAVFRMGYSTALGVTILLLVVVFVAMSQIMFKGERVEY